MRSYSCCTPAKPESTRVDSLSSLLKLVSESSRLRLLCVLRRGDHCVCELMSHVAMSQSLISHHLKDLKNADMVADTKQGLRVYYALTPKGRFITDLLFQIPNQE